VKTIKKVLPLVAGLVAFIPLSHAHYPILNCTVGNNEKAPHQVRCEASFSNRAKAPNVIMEVYSEDDEVISEGHTDNDSIYTFDRPEGVYFIIMDAGPGHVLEISDEEVVEI